MFDRSSLNLLTLTIGGWLLGTAVQGAELKSVPSVVEEHSTQKKALLPQDFLKQTKLSDIKNIARERGYDIRRYVSEIRTAQGVSFVRSADVIEELCQSDSNEEVDAGLELTLEAKRNPLLIASMVASTHSLDRTKAIIIHHIADRKFKETIAPLIQESVARGANYDTIEPIETFWEGRRLQNDPLGWLPLHREDIEQSVSFPRYSASGSIHESPSSSIQGELEKELPRTVHGKTFTATPIRFDEERAARCIHSWKSNSNGKFEAKLFETSSVISATDISTAQLLKLQLDCLAAATTSEVKLELASPQRVFEIFCGAASNGGAYPPGEYGALGRLATWQSLAALAGAGDHASFDEVDRLVKQCHWYSIAPKSKWFNNIEWDFCVVCLRPDSRHIAVLAASDED